MRNLILFALLIILLLAAQFASPKTVDEIIEKYLRARGGKDKLASVKTIYMEGVKDTLGKAVRVTVIKQQDKLSRTEIETGITSGFVLITESEAWSYFPLRAPAADKIPPEKLAGLQTEMDIAGPLADYVAKGHTAELLGKETVGDNRCYKIKLTTKEGQEMMFWVDASTYLLNQSSVIPIGGTRGVDTETFTTYRNYQEVDGIQFAHKYETTTIGAKAVKNGGEIFFHKILVNEAIDPKMFLPG